jgi:hypothetical protein
MAANSVDLTAILPALKEAVQPFEAALLAAAKIKVNPATSVRAFAPIAGLALGDVQRLVDSVNAVRRVTGDIK